MTDAAEYPLRTPEAPEGSAEASPLGEASQYRRASRLPSLHNQLSVTGATPKDPARELSAQPVLHDPDWASPLRGIRLVMQNYAESWLLYWVGYGFFLLLGMGAAQSVIPHATPLTPVQVGVAFFAGPLYGIMLDFSLILSNSPFALVGLLMIPLEPFLALLLLFTHETRERLRNCALVFGLVLVKAVVYVWVNRS